jgi:hypothetical protein
VGSILENSTLSSVRPSDSRQNSNYKGVLNTNACRDWRHGQFTKTNAYAETALMYFREQYRAKERKQIQTWIELDRAEFVRAILEASQRREEDIETRNTHQALKYLCLHISTNCYGELTHETLGKLLNIAAHF